MFSSPILGSFFIRYISSLNYAKTFLVFPSYFQVQGAIKSHRLQESHIVLKPLSTELCSNKKEVGREMSQSPGLRRHCQDLKAGCPDVLLVFGTNMLRSQSQVLPVASSAEGGSPAEPAKGKVLLGPNQTELQKTAISRMIFSPLLSFTIWRRNILIQIAVTADSVLPYLSTCLSIFFHTDPFNLYFLKIKL